MRLASWMATASGRGLRVLVGLVLIGVGIEIGGVLGLVLGIVGLVPALAGIGNVCLIAPLFRAPLRGGRVRAA